MYLYVQKDLASNNLKWLICYKTEPNQTKSGKINYIWKHLTVCK